MQKVYLGVILRDKHARNVESLDWIESEESLQYGWHWDLTWSFADSETQTAFESCHRLRQGGWAYLSLTGSGCYCECLLGKGITLGKVVSYSPGQVIIGVNSRYFQQLGDGCIHSEEEIWWGWELHRMQWSGRKAKGNGGDRRHFVSKLIHTDNVCLLFYILLFPNILHKAHIYFKIN